ncbi:hypothetical protein ABH999_000680 [Bradyrhizobium yuanmingense]
MLRRSPVNCGGTRPPAAAGGVSGNNCPMACRPICPPAQADQAWDQRSLAHLCGGETCRRRCSSLVIPGPAVRWNGRRHGRRKDRRWAKAWSPEQIARRLPIDFPDGETMRISHEAIYQALFVQGRGALRAELTACLRIGRLLRVPRARVRRRGKRFVSPEILISERPAEAADRAVPGDWEGDLILGLGNSAIGTLVERTTRFTALFIARRSGSEERGDQDGESVSRRDDDRRDDCRAQEFCLL